MPGKLRLGLLGTGIAPRLLYLPAFQKLAHEIELVACASRRRKKAEDYARLAGIPKVVNGADELLALPEVEAVLISLPIDLQPRYVLEALAAGKPVLSEKPVGPTVAAGRRLIRAAARFDAPWLVGENFAFMPHVHRLRKWIDQDRLGVVRLVHAVQMTWMDGKSPYMATGWRQKPKHVGGFVADAGVHVANALRRCFGTPTVVKNLTAQFDPKLVPLDTAVAALRFESGALGTWTSCFSARYSGPMLRVYGSNANAELRWNEVVMQNARGRETTYRPPVSSFEAQFHHFVEVVKRGKPVAVTPEETLADLALLEAIVRKR